MAGQPRNSTRNYRGNIQERAFKIPDRHVAAALCLALVAALLYGGAGAARSEVFERRFETAVPDLLSARVGPSDIYDEAAEVVIFCFDAPLHATVTGAGFTLVGSNSAKTVDSSSASRSAIDATCVEARFAAGIDVFRYSVATAKAGAVKDQRGFDSVRASVPLEGSSVADAPGDTTKPELVEARLVPDSNNVVFVFDEPLDPKIDRVAQLVPGVPVNNPTTSNNPLPGNFKFFNADGAEFSGATVVKIEKDEVTVDFGANSPAAAVRFAVLENTIWDRQGASRGGEQNNFTAVGGETARPDLARAQLVPGTTQIDFDFDELVDAPVAASFLAFTQDGTKFVSNAAFAIGNGRIRANFPAVADFSHKVVRAAVLNGAVKSSADTNKASLMADTPLRPSGAVPGFTDGPDLIQVFIDQSNHMATFEFDSKLKRPLAVNGQANFALVDSDGKVAPGQQIVGWGDNTIRIGFRGAEIDLQKVVAGSIAFDAIQDPQGKPSPAQTLGDGFRVKTPEFSPGDPAGPAVVGQPTVVTSEASEGVTSVRRRPTSFSVLVTDDAGAPMVGTKVTFDSDGVGEIRTPEVMTDSAGWAEVTVVSSQIGPQKVVANVTGCAQGRRCVETTEIRWVANETQLDCTMVGTAAADTLQGTDGDDVICGFGSDDVIKGRGGRDRLYGDGGDDILLGGPGADVLIGGAGSDVCTVTKGDRLRGCESRG